MTCNSHNSLYIISRYRLHFDRESKDEIEARKKASREPLEYVTEVPRPFCYYYYLTTTAITTTTTTTTTTPLPLQLQLPLPLPLPLPLILLPLSLLLLVLLLLLLLSLLLLLLLLLSLTNYKATTSFCFTKVSNHCLYLSGHWLKVQPNGWAY